MNLRPARLEFTLKSCAEGTSARACTFRTHHSEVRTPLFMPVATLAVLRTQHTGDVESIGFPVLLANTYHLILRPGIEVFKKFNGIHNFMKWNGSVLTDSGGFQVFSFSKNVKVTCEGAEFRSYLDGKKFMLGPESSIAAQRIIGSDIMMAMDQCVPSSSDRKTCISAVETTAKWAERSLSARGESWQSIFGIVQGACYPDLRRTSAAQIRSMPFDGYAIGGLAVGESADERNDMTELTASLLPHDRPRYLMGVGTPLDLLEAVHRGVDMFDCILPTALAQQGVAFTSRGRIELRRGVHKLSDSPLDENCRCHTCTNYSRAYLHHLVKSGEYYGSSLIGDHNLTFYKNLMDTMRSHITNGTFNSFYNSRREILGMDDIDNPVTHPRKKNRPSMLRLGDYEIIKQDAGFCSIKQVSSGEIMHSVSEPLEESRILYADQTRFEATATGPQEDLFIIWDVGMGAATNVMAAMKKYERLCESGLPLRGLKIISFENDLDPLKLAAKNPSLFPHMRHPAPGAILASGLWSSKRFPVTWVLKAGEFPGTMEEADQPDCIYYDPFSLNTDSGLWNYDVFSRIHSFCRGKPARLFTYSSSTRVRASLLAAGFYVGAGTGTGPKTETTAAITSIGHGNMGIRLLENDWFERFTRSSSRYDESLSESENLKIDKLVLSHPQFIPPR